MATEVIMPKVDMVMETGTFVEWLKKEGEHVNKGDPLFVIDTDKAAIEMESPGDGILAGVKAKAQRCDPGHRNHRLHPCSGRSAANEKRRLNKSSRFPRRLPFKSQRVSNRQPVAKAVESDKVRVTPVARRLAQELHIDLTQITGRGPRGRIHKEDVLAFQKSHSVVDCPAVPEVKPEPVISAPPQSRRLLRCPHRSLSRMPAASRSCRWPARARSSPSAWPTAHPPFRILRCLCAWI